MSLSNKLDYLEETKAQIKNAIMQKGIQIADTDTFRSYANKISQIKESGNISSDDDWQPELDWRNIEDILDNDTEEYEQKMILLLTDELDDSVKCEIKGFQKYKLSDGQTIEANTSTLTELEFNTSKDKECSKGYNTRYVICYSNSANALNVSLPENIIYIILKKIKASVSFLNNKYFLEGVRINELNMANTSFSSFFKDNVNLKKIEGFPENTNFMSSNKSIMNIFNGCISLKENIVKDFTGKTELNNLFYQCEKINNLDKTIFDENTTNLSSAFMGMTNIKELLFDFSTGTLHTISQAFNGCKKLKKIGKLNLLNAITQSSNNNVFTGCVSLIDIEEITNISISLNFSTCTLLSHLTLLRILNGLVDLTGQDNKTLTLGIVNLNKLTDEEKSIATNKNWILK